MEITLSIVTAYFIIKFIEYTFKVFGEHDWNDKRSVDQMMEDFKSRKASQKAS